MSILSKNLSTLGLIGIFFFLLSDTANAQTCPGNMTHYWELNETGTPTTFFDSYVGANNAYCDTDCPEPITGIVSVAQYFDGIDDEINVEDDGTPGTFDWGADKSFSIELWMNSNNLPGNRVFVGRDDGNIHWWVGSMSGSAAFCLYTSGDGACVTGGDSLDDENEIWHHIVAVRDDRLDDSLDENRIYVDGVLTASAPHTYTTGFGSSTELNIGHLNNDYNYNGILDEVALYNRALTETEIINHYNASYYLGRGYCNICDTSVNIMPLGDSITTGNSSGTDPDDEGHWVSYRKYLWDSLDDNGYEVDFVGGLSYGYDIPDFDPDNEGNLGVSDAWTADNVYSFLVNTPADVVLLHIGTNELDTSPDDVEDILDEIDLYEADTGNTVTVILARIINTNPYTSDTTLFNQYVAEMAQARIANGDKIIIVDMEDGAGIIYTTPPAGDMWNTHHPYATGYEKMGAVFYDALASILPGCTPTPPTIISTPVTEATVGLTYTYDVDATGYPVPTYSLTTNPTGMTIDPNTGLIEWTPDAAGDFDVVILASNGEIPDDTQPFTINVVEAPSCPDDMSHYWMLNETIAPYQDSIIADKNDAVCGTDCPIETTGIVGGAQYFDGSNDEINVDDDGTPGTFDWGADDSFSIEFWMNTNNLPGNIVIIGRDDGSIHWWVGSMDGSAAFCLYTSGDGACVTGGDSLDDENEIWHHIVAVRDDCLDDSLDENRIYVDGVLTASAPHTYTTGFGSSTELNIGHLNNDYRYNGILDEVALWDKALTIEEIEAHHDAGRFDGLGYCDDTAECQVDEDCDDGVFCNGEEICDEDNVCQSGTPSDCDDGVDCTDDSCDPGTDSCLNEPNDGFCGNGDWCDGDEFCDPVLDCQDGTPVDCDDGFYCNGNESCDEDTDQCVVAEEPCAFCYPDGCFCDEEIDTCKYDDGDADGDGVNDDEDSCPNSDLEETIIIGKCDTGVDNYLFENGCTMKDLINDCADHAIDSCPECPDDIDWDDDMEDGEFCISGICLPGIEFCLDDYEMDDCVNTTNHKKFVSCVDHLTKDWKKRRLISKKEKKAIIKCAVQFDIPSTSSTTTTTVIPPPPECESDLDCDDELYCNGLETCDENECQAGSNPCPDDGLFCNGAESCDDDTDACVFPGNPCGPDLICNEEIDSCLECLDDTDCDDGLFCNGEEFCVAGICLPGVEEPCSDDGLFCNGAESCNDETDTCVFPGNPCEPNLICDEEIDSCVGCLKDADCDDDLFCNGTETCAEGICQPGDHPCPEGTVCHEETDSCKTTTTTSVSPGPGPVPPTTTTTSTPECENDEECEDDLFCNGEEFCIEGECQAGIEPCSDDGLFCNGVESCDDDNDTCIHTGNPCQEWETCDEETDECLPEASSPTIVLIPDSAWYSQLVPFPLIILINGQDTHFNKTTTVDFNNDLIWPPVHLVLSPTYIFVFSVIKPISMGTIPEVKLTVSTKTSSGTIEEVTESLTLKKISWVLKE